MVLKDTKWQARWSWTQNGQYDANNVEQGQTDETLLIGQPPEQWLPTAFMAFAIARGCDQTFSSYEPGCVICSDRIHKNDILFSVRMDWGHSI